MISSFYTGIIFIMIFALVVIIFIVSKNNLLSKSSKKSLVKLYVLLITVACFEWLGLFLNQKPSNTAFIHGVVKAVEYALTPYLCIQFLNVIDLRNKWFLALARINVLLQFSSLVTGLTFYIDNNNVYQHGPWYWVYTSICILCSMYTLLTGLRFGNHFQSSSKKTSVSLALLLMSGIIIREINDEVRLELLGITFVAIFMYIYYVDILQKSDPLTGLLNRGSYIGKMTDMCDKVAILYFDVDEFKAVNDNYGHMHGDMVLGLIGQTIKNVYGKYGSCYRIGGDEFCVILEDRIDDIENLNMEFTNKITEYVKTQEGMPTVSLGSSIFDPQKDSMEDVVHRADTNMYRTKHKLSKALYETNKKLLATVEAFQIAAEESSTLVFIYDLEEQSILVDERTAKAFGVKEKQEGVPYQTAKLGIVSEDTVGEYIRIHEEMLSGAEKSTGVVRLIQTDGSQSLQKLSFRAVLDDDGNPTGNAVGVYSVINTEE